MEPVELSPIGDGKSNPIKIKGLETYRDTSDEVFQVPSEIVTSMDKTLPLSALRAAVASCLAVSEDAVSFVHDGAALDMGKTISDNNIVEPGPAAKKKGHKVDIFISLNTNPGELLRQQRDAEADEKRKIEEAEARKIREEEQIKKNEEVERLRKQEQELIWSTMLFMGDQTTILDETLWDLGYKEIVLDVLSRRFKSWADVGFDSYEAMVASVCEGVSSYVDGKGRRGAMVRGLDKATADEICGQFALYKHSISCATEMDEPGGDAAKRVRKGGKGDHWNPPRPREEEAPAGEKLVITVNRKRVLSSAIPLILKADPKQLRPGAIKMKYEDEAGEGKGVNREFVTNVCSRLVEPTFCLFLPSAQGRMFLNPLLDLCREAGLCWQEDDLASVSAPDVCRFFGRILAMALIQEAPLGTFFAPSLYKQLLGDVPTFADMKFVPGLAGDSGIGWYSSIFNLLGQRVDEEFLGLEKGSAGFLERTASTTVDAIGLGCEMPSASSQALESLSSIFGKSQDALREELGKNLDTDKRKELDQTHCTIEGEGMEATKDGPASLTSENIADFSRAVVQKALTDNLQPNLGLIIEEFCKVVPEGRLENYSWTQLELNLGGRLMGADHIDEWKKRTSYKDYKEDSQVVVWWWEYVHECSQADGRRMKNLFSWCTGFSGAMPISWRFQIAKIEDTKRHPSANTCMTNSTGAGNSGDPMPTLYLPPYEREEDFVKKLEEAQLVKSFDYV